LAAAAAAADAAADVTAEAVAFYCCCCCWGFGCCWMLHQLHKLPLPLLLLPEHCCVLQSLLLLTRGPIQQSEKGILNVCQIC
jgi:hypothetical protein